MAKVKTAGQRFGEWLERHVKCLEGVKNGSRGWNDYEESALEQARFVLDTYSAMTGYSGPKREVGRHAAPLRG